MPHAVIVVHTEPAGADQVEEFNRWYDHVHVPEILEQVPGIVGARRYLASPSGPYAPAQPYLAIYEIDAEDHEAVLAELQRAVAAGELSSTSSLSRSPQPSMTLYRSI